MNISIKKFSGAYIAILSFVFLPIVTFASVSVNSISTYSLSPTAGHYIMSKSVSGTDRLLVVSGGANGPGSCSNPVATYNGVSMTKLAVNTSGFDAIFILLNPDTGTHDIDMYIGTCTQPGDWIVTVFNGVNQVSQPDSFTNNLYPTDPNVTASTNVVTNGSLLYAHVVAPGADTFTAGLGTSVIDSIQAIGGKTYGVLTSSSSVASGSQSLNWNLSARSYIFSISPSESEVPPEEPLGSNTETASKAIGVSIGAGLIALAMRRLLVVV